MQDTILDDAKALLDKELLGKLNDEQNEAVERIKSQASILKGLVDDILDIHKLELGKLNFSYDEVDVQKIINSIQKNATELGKKKRITIINSTKEKIYLTTDKNRIIQVLNNFIYNALDFVPKDKGIIEINATKTNGDVRFFVRDNGIGIESSHLQDVFKKFYQEDISYKREHGGSGLGLAICKGIIEGFGGKIWVESEIEKGSTFYFTIPNKISFTEFNEKIEKLSS